MATGELAAQEQSLWNHQRGSYGGVQEKYLASDGGRRRRRMGGEAVENLFSDGGRHCVGRPGGRRRATSVGRRGKRRRAGGEPVENLFRDGGGRRRAGGEPVENLFRDGGRRCVGSRGGRRRVGRRGKRRRATADRRRRRGRDAMCKAEGRLRPIYSKEEGGCRGGCGARGADARRTGEMSYQFFLVGRVFLAVEKEVLYTIIHNSQVTRTTDA
jgi:hypothetical protein